MSLVNSEEVPDHNLVEFKGYSSSVASEGTKLDSSSSSQKEPDVEVTCTEKGLPPVDRGVRAWLFLLACSMLEALVWGAFRSAWPSFEVHAGANEGIGYADAFGVFQDYYSEHEPFKESDDIAVIGTCAMV